MFPQSAYQKIKGKNAYSMVLMGDTVQCIISFK